MCFLLLIVYFFEPLVGVIVKKFFPKYIVGEIEVDEDVESYWASLDSD